MEACQLRGGLLFPSRVIYSKNEQRRRIDQAIDDALDALSAGSSDDFVDRVAALLASELIDPLRCFKDPGFKDPE